MEYPRRRELRIKQEACIVAAAAGQANKKYSVKFKIHPRAVIIFVRTTYFSANKRDEILYTLRDWQINTLSRGRNTIDTTRHDTIGRPASDRGG